MLHAEGGDDDVDDDAGGKAPKMASSKHLKGVISFSNRVNVLLLLLLLS